MSRAMVRFAQLSALTRRYVEALRDDRAGVAATEFALLLPLMITLYLGGVEVSQAVAIDRKVSLTARTVADLTSQSSVINNTDMQNILDASTAVMSPYGASNVQIVLSFVQLDATKTATVGWSDAKNASPRPQNSSVSVPSGIAIANSTLVMAEVKYPYKPTIGYVITGTLNLTETFFMRPRLQDTITRTAS